MKEPKKIPIHGTEFLIQTHPFMEGLPIAFELNKSIRAYVLNSQKATMAAMDSLDEDTRKKLEDPSLSETERQKLWTEAIMPKLDRASLISSAVDFLSSLEPERMTSLALKLFKYVHVGAEKLDNEATLRRVMTGNYKCVVPLMAAVIEQNDFLDLSGEELLNLGA